jgi:hypothetical protein
MLALRCHREGFVLVLAVAALVSTGWAWHQLSRLPALESARAMKEAALVPVEIVGKPERKTAIWPEPVPQARGREWIFDLFTPPEIFYAEDSRQFSVIPPRLAAVAAKPEPDDFGLTLVGVRREPYRLQLVGFLGDEGNALGAFENILSTEHFLARSGHRVPALGLTIEDFAVKRLSTMSGPSDRSAGLTAVAVVRDDETGEHVSLTSDLRCEAGERVAILRSAGSDEQTVELREGETAEIGAVRYRVDSIHSDPLAVVVARLGAESKSNVTQTLKPLESSDGSR